MFVFSAPPYLQSYPDSATQYKSPEPSAYLIDIQNAYIQYSNNISLSNVTCDYSKQQLLSQYLRVSVMADNPEQQEFIGFVNTSKVLVHAMTISFYCPKDFVGSVIPLTIKLRWEGVNFIQNTYSLPIYCMECDDPKLCSNSSVDHYASLKDW